MTTFLSIDRPSLDRARKEGGGPYRGPLMRVQEGSLNAPATYADEVVIHGPATMRYDPETVNDYGIVLWIETEGEVTMKGHIRAPEEV